MPNPPALYDNGRYRVDAPIVLEHWPGRPIRFSVKGYRFERPPGNDQPHEITWHIEQFDGFANPGRHGFLWLERRMSIEEAARRAVEYADLLLTWDEQNAANRRRGERAVRTEADIRRITREL